MAKLYTVKITSAIALDGVIHRAGSVVECPEGVAKDLLRRGKAEPHESTSADDAADAPAPAEPAKVDETSADDEPEKRAKKSTK